MTPICKQGLHREGAAMPSNAGAGAAGLRYSAFIGNRLRRGDDLQFRAGFGVRNGRAGRRLLMVPGIVFPDNLNANQ